MIIVTGGAGFIGSNLVRALNARGRRDVLVVDDLSDGTKFVNLVGCDILDYLDRSAFRDRIQRGASFGERVRALFHQGACSATTEWDGRYMMENNFEYSKVLLEYCTKQQAPLIYASSAAVYGGSDRFVEDPACEAPLNVYGYSKALFDQWVRRALPRTKSQVVGLRYFNVYGPREGHKGSMASVAFHLNRQLSETGVLRLFAGSGGYGDGEQRRDFIYVDDVVAVNLWFWDNPTHSGIFNVGTGRAQTFNDVARAVIAFAKRGEIAYIPFPDSLRGRYQSFTQADLTNLRAAGYQKSFQSVEQGVAAYMAWLNQS